MHSSNEYDIVCRYPAFEVRLNKLSGQQGLFSTESYDTGACLIQFSIRSVQSTPTYLTVQIGEQEHCEFEPDHLKFLNHACEPNVFLDLTNHTLIAESKIESGDELRFFYPSTEWKMNRSFTCNCGSANCIDTVSGAHALSKSQLSNYKLSPYIQQKLTN